MEVLNRMPFEKKNFIFSKLAEIAEVRKLTEEERTAYDTSLRKYRDTIAVMSTARNEGMEKGFEKGRKEGRKAGRQEGLKEGRKEVALKLLELGLPMSQIEAATGLSADEIGN